MLSVASELGRATRHWIQDFSCHSSECLGPRRIWRHFAHGAASLRLQGVPYCFAGCFERELHRRLEELSRSANPKPRPPHRVPLGLLLLSRGELSDKQLRHALDTQRQSGSGRIGEWIIKLGYGDEQQILGALAAQWSCPVLRNPPQRLPECGIPAQLLLKFRMLPVHYGRSANVIHIAFAQDVQYQALLAIEQMLGCRAEACLVSASSLGNLLNWAEEERHENDHVFHGPRTSQEIARITCSYSARLGAQNVRVVVCGECIWIRVFSQASFANLLFPLPNMRG